MSHPARLAVAAAVCVVSLGLGWSSSLSSIGYQTPGMNLVTTWSSPFSDDVSLGLTYVPGSWVDADPFRARKGHEADVRVVLVPAAVVLGLAARAASRSGGSAELDRAARVAVAATAILALLAVSRGMLGAAASMLVVVGLAAPVVTAGAWSRWAPRRVRTVASG